MSLRVEVHPDQRSLAAAAATRAAAVLREAVAARGEARVAFAAAPSQDAFLAALRESDVPWSAVTAFQLDEYLGLDDGAPQLFRRYLTEHLFRHVRPGTTHLLRPPGQDLDGAAVADRYARLLGDAPLDLACLGIGENGHLAFNDPPVADLEDPWSVKVVALDAACRRQQVNDGAFAALDAVPTTAVTLTIPTLLRARAIVCVVPGEHKRAAVTAALHGPVTPACPASALQRHPAARLYLDAASGAGEAPAEAETAHVHEGDAP